MKSNFWFFVVLLFSINGFSQVNIADIPSPKEEGQEFFVTDTTQEIYPSIKNELNQISQRIDSLTQVEYAIVFVDDFNGDDIFTFSLELFNTWAIGKKESDNGLLLFLSKNTREYWFTSGAGIEGIMTDAYLKRIGETYIVPNFKRGDYNSGLLETSRIIEQILLAPDSKAELESLFPKEHPWYSPKNKCISDSLTILALLVVFYFWIHFSEKLTKGKLKKKSKYFHPIISGCGCMGILMFLSIFVFAFGFNNLEHVYVKKNVPYFILVLALLILAMKYTMSRTAVQESFSDEQNKSKALNKFMWLSIIPAIVTPLAYFDLFKIGQNLSQSNSRFSPPDKSVAWVRINREGMDNKTLSQYLDKGQLYEERIGVLKYEIWKHSQNGKIVLKPWVLKKSYKPCPSCGYKTFQTNIRKTINEATYSSTGLGLKLDECGYCNHSVSHENFIIPKKTRSTSSSSSGGSSRGGGSSRSSGSFGGGSSRGGGAGGSW